MPRIVVHCAPPVQHSLVYIRGVFSRVHLNSTQEVCAVPVCRRCETPKRPDQMSRSKNETAGMCRGCAVEYTATIRPRRVCVKCQQPKGYDHMSRAKGATAGWCLACADEADLPRVRIKTTTPKEPRLPPQGLVEFRKRYGLSQAQLAVAIKVSVPAISSWECGKTAIPPVVQMSMSAYVAGLPPYR